MIRRWAPASAQRQAPPAPPAYDTSSPRLCLLPRQSLTELLAVSPMVRELCVAKDEVMVVVPSKYAACLRNVFGDVPNLRFRFSAPSWTDTVSADALAALRSAGHDVVVPLPSVRQTCPHSLLGLDPRGARTDFLLHRALPAEEALWRRVQGAVGDTFVVLHDDPRTGRAIRRELLPAGVPVVDVHDPRFRAANPLDWIQTMDRAVQVHAIDSCFLFLADALALRPRKHLHAYASPPAARFLYRDVTPIYS